MRWLGIAVLFAATTASAKPSNPAFLGIGMRDAGGVRGAGPCMVTSVTPGTGAQQAGIEAGDLLLRIDDKVISDCDALSKLIMAREPGEVITLELRRGGGTSPLVTVSAQLLTRAELLRRRFVDQPVPMANLTRIDTEATIDLSARRRKTTIIGWFSPACASEGCNEVFAKVARWSRTATKGTPISVVAATAGRDHKSLEENLEELKLLSRYLDVPLLVADQETYNEFSINDDDRVHFMVIDARGIVRFVVPVVPNAEDSAALLDELFAAAEQAQRTH